MSLSDARPDPARSAACSGRFAILGRPARRRTLALIALTCAAAGLAACGYRPLYGRAAGGTQVSSELSKVRIGLIANRAGHRLRNHLLDRMNPHGEPASPAYMLSVNLQESRADLGVRRDDTRTRANLTLAATFQLVDVKTSRVLFRGDAQRVASFNIRTAEFSTISAESAARRRSVEGLADEITQRVAIYLNRKTAEKR
jgi:LPS-assembly lipoprotein